MADDPLFDQDPFEEKSVNVIDWGRLIFTFVLLFALLGFLCLYVYLSATTKGEDWTRIKDAFQVILPILTGVLGTAVVFYFGKPGK
jgi:purine-cytosine permease-like protein